RHCEACSDSAARIYMIRRQFWVLALLMLATLHQRAATQTSARFSRTPVLVELFTSEGCSSCPPADQVLIELAEQQPVDGVEVIGMSEDVDYWNRLGWSDPFSSVQFSNRQNEYAAAFRRTDIYTPQMIVDGHIEFVGNSRTQTIRTVGRAAQQPKGQIAI